jgi:hypothetical protein
LRAPVRSDPRSWNGRPDGTGEAAMPQQPCRGCHAARGSTLTSWRRGRLGRNGSRGERGPETRGVVCRRRSERWMLARGLRVWCQDASARPTATSQPVKRVAITRRPWSVRAFGPGGPGMILRNHRGSATSPDTSASAEVGFRQLKPLVESLILAQDQRWRRA